ncbi:tRNA pseudouridine synthase D, partial [Cryphonectria parasitica EP155]
ANFMPSVRAASEKKLGMLHYTSPASHGWHGDVRKRYTDFLVNEIRKDGKVLHLENYDVAERPADVVCKSMTCLVQLSRYGASLTSMQNIFLPGQQGSPNNLTSYSAEIAPARTVTEDDEKALRALLGEATTTEVLNLYQRIVASGTTRLDPQINLVKFLSMERDVRGRVHQEIRRIFDSRIATETDGDGIITAIPASIRFARKPRAAGSGGRNQRSNQPSFKKLGGDYLHFTLYKENKDTMDAVNQIGRILRVKSNNFGFAGTKDRRAATVQRVSVYRVRHKVLDFLNTQLPYMKMGDYKYSPYPIQLGDHGGNEFNIVVKDVGVKRGEDCSLERRVQLTKQAVETAVNEMVKYGFINYYGLQRFGTHIVGTHELGKLMLMEKFDDVVDGILHVDKDFMNQVVAGTVQETPSSRDEINRARAIVQFKTYKNAKSALQLMPKRFASEMNVIQHLEKSPRDFTGAILTITRGMRNLYLHAYQSYVWNHAASHRWAKYGSKVIPGDLVLVTPEDTVVDDSIGGSEESQYQKARALSEEQANSGKYTIYDIVLPGPGFDVVYPDNDIGEFYVEFMLRPENGGLDPHRMRRSTKDFSVSGSYRHVLGRMKGQPKWEVRTYVDENDQMVPTDLDLIELRKAAEKPTLQKEAAEQVAGNQAVAVTAEAGQLADDGAAKTERRRQREDPESDPRANETWTEVSQNGGSKRIKL